MEDGNLAVLVDAKTEYTKQLVNILKQNMYMGVKNILQEAKNECALNKDQDSTMKYFQDLLSQIPKWNQDIINKESVRIIEESGCDWLDDLITAVFVSHTRILTSINFSKNKKKINLKIPKIEHFIHQCYIEIARSFWKNPYMFDDQIYKYDYQRNRRDCEVIIEQCITETVRKQLPVKDILKEYLIPEEDKEEEKQLNETKDENEKLQESLREMVKAELMKAESIKADTDVEIKEVMPTESESIDDSIPETVLQKEEPILEEVKPVIESVYNEVKEPVIESVYNEVKEPVKPIIESVPEPMLQKEEVEPVKPVLEEVKPVYNEVKEQVYKEVKESVPEVKPILEQVYNEVKETAPEDNLSMDVDELKTEELDLDSLINSEVNLDKKEEPLQIDTLDLDNMDDLSKLEEVYVDEPFKVDEPVQSPVEVEIKSVENSDIKKIHLETTEKKPENNDDKLTLNVSKQYTKNKADFDFFADAKELE
jgi:hypothetical protein